MDPERIRVSITHSLYLACTCFICWDFFKVYLVKVIEFPEIRGVIIASVVIFAIIVQGIAFGFAWKSRFSKYIDWSMFAFFLSTSVLYGLSIWQSFVEVNPHFNEDHIGQQGNRTIDCFSVQLDNLSNMKYLSPILLLVITSACYPYPEEEKRNFEKSLAFGMGMIDSVDMMELLYGDLACFQKYTFEWRFLFFLTLGISLFLLTLTRGLEARTGEKKTGGDLTTTLLKMVGNNVFMCLLRITVMVKENHISLLFVLLEIMVFIGRFISVCYYFLWYDSDD